MSRLLQTFSPLLKLLPATGLLVLCLHAAAASSGNTALDDVTDLDWRYRVLLIRAPANHSAVDALHRQAAAAAERDLLWFVFQEERLTTNYAGALAPALVSALRARLSAAAAHVLLIGKDGGTKLVLTDDRDLDLGRVFARIDSMPMRQRELRDLNPE